jgi:hypothetical protein
MSLCTTLAISFLSEDRKKTLKFYITTIAFFYVMFCIVHGCYSNEEQEQRYKDNFFIETSDGCYFLFDNSSIDEEYISKAKFYTRNQLLTLMIGHRASHDAAIKRAEKIVSSAHLLTPTLKDLFDVTKTAVATYAGGGKRSFIQPAIAAIIEYSFAKGFKACEIWHDYEIAIMEANYHAELFDFYMNILQKL